MEIRLHVFGAENVFFAAPKAPQKFLAQVGLPPRGPPPPPQNFVHSKMAKNEEFSF